MIRTPAGEKENLLFILFSAQYTMFEGTYVCKNINLLFLLFILNDFFTLGGGAAGKYF